MIQLYLLIIIIIFLMLFINKKEFFKDNGCKGIINWEDGRLLYGCSTYDKDKKKVKITIVWDFVPEPNDRYFILMKNIKNAMK